MSIILANFWTWAGTTILVAVTLGGIADCIKAARGPREPVRRIKSYDFDNGSSTVEIENATDEDLEAIIGAFCGRSEAVSMEGKGNGEE